jgi:hypothetical protein
MNWTFRANIIVTKLPTNWQEKGKFMVYHVVYLAKAYDIPPHMLSIMIKPTSIWYLQLENVHWKVRAPNIFSA